MRQLNEVYEIIDDFDTNNDGELNLEEFVNAFAVIGGDVMASEKVNANVYDKRVEQHLTRIKGLFNKLDTDKSGQLDGAEMKRVIELYSGEKFVYADFLGWYDSNGSKGDGSFDVKEFGWSAVQPAERASLVVRARSHKVDSSPVIEHAS